jgi:glycosyltransferase involved in cell wall biosynthesis
MTDGRPLRILYVLPYLPSPIRVRPYQIIRRLAALGHDVTVAALDDGLIDPEARAEMERVCRAVHVVPLERRRAALSALASLPTRTPLWAAWCRSPEMERLLRRLAGSGEFDVAHVEHLRAAHFAAALAPLPLALDAVDCITALRRQMIDQAGAETVNRVLSYLEWRKLRGYEPRVYRRFGGIVVTSSHDAQALIALDPLLPPIEVLPNGVDLLYFDPKGAKPRPKHLIFSGKMSYSANDDAARYLMNTIFPRLRRRDPDAQLAIVGSAPTPALRRDAARTEGVVVTGYVEDLRPYLWNAAIAVCPMRVAVGIQNKVLEAMAASRPVVCSSLAARAVAAVANQAGAGVPADAEAAVQVADDPEVFAQRCAVLMEAPETAERAGKAARQYVEKYHDWNGTAYGMLLLYRKVIAEQASRPG